MPFNSRTYYVNKYRRQAREALEAARAGPPAWSSRSVEDWRKTRVALARERWRCYRSQRFLQRMAVDLRTMSAADFIAKYEVEK